MEKNWNFPQKVDEKLFNTLKSELKIDDFLINLLIQRNITTFDEAKTFFRPSLEQLHDPFLMLDMKKAVERLQTAIQNNEKILIYGDYDVDGTTSVALIYLYLIKFYKNIDFYIPDRYKEGYGISLLGIDYAKENNCSLIIALDCGIKAVSQIKYANEKNIDFVICDHHTPGDIIPDAVAVLDPKQKNCKYPFKELSGCGVGFKFMQAFSETNNYDINNLYELLDIVTVSIASDIVPIIGENRILSFFGLQQLDKTNNIGLKVLIEIAAMNNKKFTISDCVFKIGPRINAAGRIKSGKYAVKLLIETDAQVAEEFGTQINDYNITRKNLDKNITQESLDIIKNNEELQNRKTTVLYKPDWHKGVIGIVASRLTETYYRPTIILTKSGGKLTGSARSVPGFNLYNAIDNCSELLAGFGGHKYAAGMNMKEENFEQFQKCFEKSVSETITAEQLVPKINVDAKISFKTITDKFFRILKQFAPFGPNNMTPIFVTENVRDTGNSRPVGKTYEHLKLELIDESGAIMSGIGFSMGNLFSEIKTKKTFSVCYSIEENTFRGKVSLQMMIRDIKF